MEEFTKEELEIIVASLAMSASITATIGSMPKVIQKLMNLKDKAEAMVKAMPATPKA